MPCRTLSVSTALDGPAALACRDCLLAAYLWPQVHAFAKSGPVHTALSERDHDRADADRLLVDDRRMAPFALVLVRHDLHHGAVVEVANRNIDLFYARTGA
jgi:hypothetical protein